jgi:hypothetical protein
MTIETINLPPAASNPPLDPREIFKHAMLYANTDNFLHTITGNNAFAYINLAAIVVNAFAIELFFKCIIAIDNPGITRKSLKAHDLLELFNTQ